MAYMFKDPQVKLAFQNIVATITGEDGGGKFMALRAVIETLDKQDDAASKKLLDIVKQFSKLIDIADREFYK